jgi:hypothetical protein
MIQQLPEGETILATLSTADHQRLLCLQNLVNWVNLENKLNKLKNLNKQLQKKNRKLERRQAPEQTQKVRRTKKEKRQNLTQPQKKDQKNLEGQKVAQNKINRVPEKDQTVQNTDADKEDHQVQHFVPDRGSDLQEFPGL